MIIVAPANVPQGNYVNAKRHGDLIFTSGMTPRRAGVLALTGAIDSDTPLETSQEITVLAAANALAVARLIIGAHERLSGILSLTVFIAANAQFTAHSQLADFASEYLQDQLGHAGVACRATVGVASLPGGAPVEIQLIATVAPIVADAADSGEEV